MTKQRSPVKKPWGGRFKSALDPLVRQYTASLHLDRRLAPYDLRGSRAHVAMLTKQGILSGKEADRILAGLGVIEKEIENGKFPFREDLEDIHMNIETRLQELIGEAGKKIHTGRSRNDQVALDLKLFCLDVARDWQGNLLELQTSLRDRARQAGSELFPGWTHLQAAQPIGWAHYLMAFMEMFCRDYSRLDFYAELHSVCPLGAGALSGSTLPLDPEESARQLHFKSSFRNSYDVVGDRDFILEILQIASQSMLHASRLAEDFIYMSSTPVGWIELPDSLCTGSSMMPQKKNPDVLELTRGKTALVLGHASGLATLLKGLPSSYNRDLQQDKEHLFQAVATTTETLGILPLVIGGFQIRTERTAAGLKQGFLMATDLAEYLVRRGVPFRSAHEKVGRLVGYCLAEGVGLEGLSVTTIKEMIPECDEDVSEVLSPEGTLSRRTHKGSAGLQSIKEQLAFWDQWIDTETRRFTEPQA